jgi:hypothetical protein
MVNLRKYVKQFLLWAGLVALFLILLHYGVSAWDAIGVIAVMIFFIVVAARGVTVVHTTVHSFRNALNAPDPPPADRALYNNEPKGEKEGNVWWGTIAGLAIGAWLSYSFILPADILSLKLSAMTIGDILRILGALGTTIVAAGIGHLVDIGAGNADY